MESLSESELEIVRKYYRLYSDLIPEDEADISDFLDTISTYQQSKERHNDDEMLKDDVSQIVDQYFSEYGKVLCPFGGVGTFVIEDDQIEERRQRMINWIKNARDKQTGPMYYHYVGADSSSDELCKFYYYVFNKYYEIIGTTWGNR